MVGKISPFFPMIGKFFCPFSNDWKKFRAISGKQKEQKGQQNKRRTKPSDNTDYSRQLFEETTWTTRDRQPCKVSRKVRQVRQVCGWETGDGNLQECLECRCAESDGRETGGMSTLKTKKTASRTGTRLGSGRGETTWTTRDNFCKVRRPTGRRVFWRCDILPRPAHGRRMKGVIPVEVPPAP